MCARAHYIPLIAAKQIYQMLSLSFIMIYWATAVTQGSVLLCILISLNCGTFFVALLPC